jgi:alpha-1,2-mannosyltransferase
MLSEMDEVLSIRKSLMTSSIFLKKLNLLLTPQRINYVWLAGGAMWLGWLVSICLGSGKFDVFHQVIGNDYIQFYSSGVTLRQGAAEQLYNGNFQLDLEKSIVGSEMEGYYAFITLPFLAWLFVPFSFLPYILSFFLWSLVGVLILWVSLRWLGRAELRTFGMALMWYPVFATITFGQNSLLTLGIFSLAYALWKKKRLWEAGLIASLALYKPQLILGIGFLWLLRWRKDWKALAGLCFGSLGLVGISALFLPQASLDYLSLARTVLPDMLWSPGFPYWHMHTIRGFFRLLLPEARPVADGISLLLMAPAIWFFYLFLRKLPDKDDLHFAGAICLILWLTPHAMIYEWTLLLIPAVLIWRTVPNLRNVWRPLFALIWLATFFSTALTKAQITILPFAIQITIPVLVYVFYETYRVLTKTPASGLETTM